MPKKWRWNPLHPEHLVPGSFWKLRNEVSLYYLEDPHIIDIVRGGGFVIGPASSNPRYEIQFELQKIYFLAKIEEKNGVYNITLLDDTHCIETKVVKGCWDNVFTLVRGSSNPKPERKMLLGRIPLEELNAKAKNRG